jgi:hypothetical protein
MAKLNAYNGSPDFNSRKPWSINKYGLLQGTPSPFSAYAPDDFPQFNNSKYWWMWDKWVPTGSNGYWLWPEWNGAKVESIRPYVSRCLG